MVSRMRTRHFAQAKAEGRKISCLTAYDAPTAAIFDEAGIDLLLVGDSADGAYYLRSEIATAISLARLDDERHRVIPVYLTGAAGRSAAQPYGLNLKHGLDIDDATDLKTAATRILQTLEATRPAELLR